jgi:DNA-binding transcriptional MerR regulator
VSWQRAAAAGSAPKSLPETGEPGAEELRTITQVQQETGLSARTLRYYEELGLLPGVRRRAGGRRVYGADQIERIHFIQRLKKLGLSLAEIKGLNAIYGIAGSTEAMLTRLDQLLEGHDAEVGSRIAELEALRGEIGQYRQRIRGRIRALEGEKA